MKTEIFNSAIKNRNRLKFLYGLDEILIEPYYLTIERTAQKLFMEKFLIRSQIKKFNFSKIANIKVLDKKRFCPIIPIIPMAS